MYSISDPENTTVNGLQGRGHLSGRRGVPAGECIYNVQTCCCSVHLNSSLLSLSAVQAGPGLPTHKSTPIMYLSTLYPALCSINHQNVQRQNKASNAKALHALVDGVSRVPHKYCHRKHHAFISCKVLTVTWLLLVFFQTQ